MSPERARPGPHARRARRPAVRGRDPAHDGIRRPMPASCRDRDHGHRHHGVRCDRTRDRGEGTDDPIGWLYATTGISHRADHDERVRDPRAHRARLARDRGWRSSSPRSRSCRRRPRSYWRCCCSRRGTCRRRRWRIVGWAIAAGSVLAVVGTALHPAPSRSRPTCTCPTPSTCRHSPRGPGSAPWPRSCSDRGGRRLRRGRRAVPTGEGRRASTTALARVRGRPRDDVSAVLVADGTQSPMSRGSPSSSRSCSPCRSRRRSRCSAIACTTSTS